MTREEISQKLLEEYNAEPIGGKILGESYRERQKQLVMQEEGKDFFERAEQLATHQLNLEEFKAQGGGEIAAILAFDTNKICYSAAWSLGKRALSSDGGTRGEKAFCSALFVN